LLAKIRLANGRKSTVLFLVIAPFVPDIDPSDFDDLARLFNDGLRNIAGEQLRPRAPPDHAHVRGLRGHNEPLTELNFIRSWLPSPEMKRDLLKHINEILGGKRAKAGKGRRSHRADVDEADLEAFLLRYFLEGLQSKGVLQRRKGIHHGPQEVAHGAHSLRRDLSCLSLEQQDH
jgi:hypothetical protein